MIVLLIWFLSVFAAVFLADALKCTVLILTGAHDHVITWRDVALSAATGLAGTALTVAIFTGAL